jgi:hypothetical protein
MPIGPLNAKPETLRSLAFGSISGSYAAVGTPLAYPCRILIITNKTNTDMLFSVDGTNNHYIIPTGTAQLIDVNSNRDGNKNGFVFAKGTQFYVKQVSAPASGAVYISSTYGVINA